jgi:hypothetical protein
MAKKQTTPKKPLTKSEKPAYTLLLKFDAKELKQLDVAKKITSEGTATKAIIKCLYNSEYYMKQYTELKERIWSLELLLATNKSAINNYLHSLKELQEVNNTKQNTSGSKKGKANVQLTIED